MQGRVTWARDVCFALALFLCEGGRGEGGEMERWVSEPRTVQGESLGTDGSLGTKDRGRWKGVLAWEEGFEDGSVCYLYGWMDGWMKVSSEGL